MDQGKANLIGIKKNLQLPFEPELPSHGVKQEMAKSIIHGSRLIGVSSCVPSTSFDNVAETQQFDPIEVKKIVALAGVKKRRISDDSTCTTDLCLQAAINLLAGVNWAPESIDALILVTQTPDYFLPSSSCILHGELGLSEHCATFDVGLGCSGYPYALWLASMMIQTRSAKRVLVLHGETPSRFTNPDDRATYLLFGDAGSATAIEANTEEENWGFCLYTDGKGYRDLVIPGGGFRNRHPASDLDYYLQMNGANLFNFTVQKIPTLIEETLSLTESTAADIDAFIFHQSNQFIMKHIAKKCGLPLEKIPIILDEYGNTGGPSVPLTLALTYSRERLTSQQQVMLLGYGVGLSWGSAQLPIHPETYFHHGDYTAKN